MFTPGYIKHGRLLIRHAEKLLRYRKDVLSESAIAELKTQIEKVKKALKDRNKQAVKAESEQLHTLYCSACPTPKDAAWRENIEVILVAIVVAIGIRSYFLQPFKIPTGSMQPTLNGIIGHKHFYQNDTESRWTRNRPTNIGTTAGTCEAIRPKIQGRVFCGGSESSSSSGAITSMWSRSEDDQVLRVRPEEISLLLHLFPDRRSASELSGLCAVGNVAGLLNVVPGRVVQKGDVIARGAIDTGDQVFVDKFSYNFVKPHRGDVFVFRTDSIQGVDPRAGAFRFVRSSVVPADESAPFYIKRLVGLPGDELRIEPPLLHVNGKLADEFGLKRVMSAVLPTAATCRGGRGLCLLARRACFGSISPRRFGCPNMVISRWATTVPIVWTAATGARCRRRIWSGAGCSFIGRSIATGV